MLLEATWWGRDWKHAEREQRKLRGQETEVNTTPFILLWYCSSSGLMQIGGTPWPGSSVAIIYHLMYRIIFYNTFGPATQ